MGKRIFLKIIFVFIAIMFINVTSVKAEDSTKCFYSLPIPDKSGNTKNIEFIVKIGSTYADKTASCRMYHDDTQKYNDNIRRDSLTDANGNVIPGCYDFKKQDGSIVYTCDYYDCWKENNGYAPYNSEVGWMYDKRNDRYVYFHYGKEFFDQYYKEGGKCPQLWGTIDQEIFYIRLNQQQSTDKGPFKPVSKTIIKNGHAEKQDPNSEEFKTEKKKCEYQFQVAINSKFIRYQMNVEKITVVGSGITTYNVTLKDSEACNQAELKAIETMQNGGWQDYIGSSFTRNQVYVSEATMKSLIDSSCESNEHLVAKNDNGLVKLVVDKSANSTVNMKGFCDANGGGSSSYTPTPADYKEKVNYKSFCSNEGVSDSFRILGMIVYVLKIAAPILIIITGIIDYFKAVTSSDEEALSKATSSLVRRIISGILVFLLPTIIWSILKLLDITDGIQDLNDSSFGVCTRCLLKNECSGTSSGGGSGSGSGTSGEAGNKHQVNIQMAQ